MKDVEEEMQTTRLFGTDSTRCRGPALRRVILGASLVAFAACKEDPPRLQAAPPAEHRAKAEPSTSAPTLAQSKPKPALPTSKSLHVTTLATANEIRLQPAVVGGTLATLTSKDGDGDGGDGKWWYARIDGSGPLAETKDNHEDHVLPSFFGTIGAGLYAQTLVFGGDRSGAPPQITRIDPGAVPAGAAAMMIAWRDGQVILDTTPQKMLGDAHRPALDLTGLGCADKTPTAVDLQSTLVDRGVGYAYLDAPITCGATTLSSNWLWRPGKDGRPIALDSDATPSSLSVGPDDVAWIGDSRGRLYRIEGEKVQKIEVPKGWTSIFAVGSTDSGTLFAVGAWDSGAHGEVKARIGDRWVPVVLDATPKGVPDDLIVRGNDVWIVFSAEPGGDTLVHATDS